MKKILGAATAALLLAGAVVGQARATELVANGGFETVDPNFQAFPLGWQVDFTQALIDAQGSDLVSCCGVVGSAAALANRAATFEGLVPGTTRLSQYLHTTAGQAYDITFDAGAVGHRSANVVISIFDSNGGGGPGGLIDGANVVVTADNNLDTTFVQYDFPFVAVSDLSLLAFSFEGTGLHIDPLLDNVSVLAPDPPVTPDNGPAGVPEPASWALTLTGFGALGALLRHRRAHAHAHASPAFS